MKDAHISKPTKRNLLKIVSSFHDPIGVIQPVLISLKILLQEAHRLKLGWDDEFCGEIKEAWERNFREIDELVNVNVDRRFESSSDEILLFAENCMVFQMRVRVVLGLVCTCVHFVDQGRLPLDY